MRKRHDGWTAAAETPVSIGNNGHRDERAIVSGERREIRVHRVGGAICGRRDEQRTGSAPPEDSEDFFRHEDSQTNCPGGEGIQANRLRVDSVTRPNN